MTKQEVNKLLALMRANYSSAFKGMSQQDKYLLLNTWTFTLQDLDANIVMIAAMELISTSKWVPTVAEIREKCRRLYYEASCASYEFPYEETPEWKKKAYQAIMDRTAHLRGDSPSASGLTLNAMLNNPKIAAMATGEGRLELMEGTDETWDDKP